MTLRLSLALQGGGAHGAFTWGVLDRLCEEEGIEIAAISGTSAGAINAAAFKTGMVKNGRTGARAELDWLWGEIGALNGDYWADWLALATPSVPMVAKMLAYSPGWLALDAGLRMSSPYMMGPLMQNPLGKLIEQMEFDAICHESGVELYINATNLRSGKVRVFSGHEISAKVLLASACLPTIFPAVEIADPRTGHLEAYWDGGYAGNPALFPLYRPHLPDDIIIVSINPQRREDLPMDSQQIQNRINEISFNAALLAELRSIAFVKRLIAEGKVEPGAMKDLHIHMISDDDLMRALNVATKTIPVPLVLSRLKEAGRAAASAFLDRHRADLGKRGTLDLAQTLR